MLTLAPTVYNLDSAELTTAAATGGLMRATGYPLYLIIGWFWSHLPIGDVGYRMNLFSAFCGALTILLVDRLLRSLKVGPWAAWGALGLLVCSTYFWGLSLIAEVYTLHTALMAGLMLLLLRWAADPTPARLGLVALLLGLSLGHHLATVLLVPGCLWYLVTVAPQKFFTVRSLGLAVVAGLVGLSIYLYLPLRYSIRPAPAFNYAGHYNATGTFIPVNLRTLDGLWWLISGKVFAGQMFAYQGPALWQEVKAYGGQLSQTFFAVGLGPGLLGLGLLVRRNWRLGGMCLLMFAGNAFFYINYNVVDKKLMFLPTYLIWTLWLGIGYQWLLNWVTDDAAPSPVALNSRRRPRRKRHRKIKRNKPAQKSISGQASLSRSWETWFLRGIMVGIVLLALTWNWLQVNLANDWSARTRGETMLNNVKPNALILGYWETVPVIQYLQLVEGHRPDVQTINRFLIKPDAMRQLVAQEVSRRPIYIDDPPAGLLDLVIVEPGPILQRLQPRQ